MALQPAMLRDSPSVSPTMIGRSHEFVEFVVPIHKGEEVLFGLGSRHKGVKGRIRPRECSNAIRQACSKVSSVSCWR